MQHGSGPVLGDCCIVVILLLKVKQCLCMSGDECSGLFGVLPARPLVETGVRPTYPLPAFHLPLHAHLCWYSVLIHHIFTHLV